MGEVEVKIKMLMIISLSIRIAMVILCVQRVIREGFAEANTIHNRKISRHLVLVGLLNLNT